MLFLPAGSQDQIGQKLNNKAKITRVFRDVVCRRDYMAIETPVIEYAQTFTNPHVGMDLSTLLKWFDYEGQIEVLRPDWTTAIARALINQPPNQKKWFYQGSIFRNDKNGIESRQAGIEIIRSSQCLGEMESLFTAVDYLKALQIDDYLIELGHTGIFEYLIQPLELNRVEEEALRTAMHDKQTDVVERIVKEKGNGQVAKELVNLIQAYGDKEVLQKYRSDWQNQTVLVEIIDLLDYLYTSLETMGANVIVDLGRVKQLPYYSGAMFRGYLKATGQICFSGGRYDKLYAQFDTDISAVGLAFDIDVLANVISPDPAKKRICLIASPETHVQAEQMRQQLEDIQVDIQYQIPAQHNYDQIIDLTKEVNES